MGATHTAQICDFERNRGSHGEGVAEEGQPIARILIRPAGFGQKDNRRTNYRQFSQCTGTSGATLR